MPGQSSPFQERSPGWGEGKIFCPHLLCPREDRRSFGPAYGIAPSKQHVGLSRRRHCNTYVTQKYQAQRNTVASLASKVKVDQIMDLLPHLTSQLRVLAEQQERQAAAAPASPSQAQAGAQAPYSFPAPRSAMPVPAKQPSSPSLASCN